MMRWLDDDVGSEKPFMEHLIDLRRMLIRSVAALIVGILLALPFAPDIYQLMLWPLRKAGEDPDTLLKTFEIAGGFMLAARIAFWSGIILSAPFIVLFIAQFVFPGLTKRERQMVVRSAGFAALLFAVGVCVCFIGTLPVGLKVMFDVGEWMGRRPGPIIVDNYLTFCLRLLIGFGLAFELPVFLIALGKLGVVNSRLLREKRRHVIVILLVIATVLTPPDVFTQLLMAVPLILLFEVSIWVLVASEKKRGVAADTGRRGAGEDSA